MLTSTNEMNITSDGTREIILDFHDQHAADRSLSAPACGSRRDACADDVLQPRLLS